MSEFKIFFQATLSLTFYVKCKWKSKKARRLCVGVILTCKVDQIQYFRGKYFEENVPLNAICYVLFFVFSESISGFGNTGLRSLRNTQKKIRKKILVYLVGFGCLSETDITSQRKHPGFQNNSLCKYWTWLIKTCQPGTIYGVILHLLSG